MTTWSRITAAGFASSDLTDEGLTRNTGLAVYDGIRAANKKEQQAPCRRKLQMTINWKLEAACR